MKKYFLLPLFYLCVIGTPAQPTAETASRNTSANNIETGFIIVSIENGNSNIPNPDNFSSNYGFDSTLDLYLLIGQSNMAGRGPVTEEYKLEGSPNVLMLSKENTWVKAAHPLHFDKPVIAGVGPGLAFGIAMSHYQPNRTIGLIPCAVGGTSINSWVPAAYDSATKTHPYDDMMIRLKTALQSGKLKGILWHQGESDSSPNKSVGYLVKLKTLIERLRTDTGNEKVPFVAGELGRYKMEYKSINNILKQLPAAVSHTVKASSKSLTDRGDNTHFNSASAKKMGIRMAKKMKQIQKKISLDY